MSSKVVIILSSPDVEVLKTGLLYGKNAKLYGWLDDVKIFVFGESERVILQHKELAKEISNMDGIACKFIAKEKGIEGKLKEYNIKTEYMGENLSNLIKEGYTPMVF